MPLRRARRGGALYRYIYTHTRPKKRACEHLRRRARESSARAALAGAVWRNRMVGQKVNV
jgi:hypothetical protein